MQPQSDSTNATGPTSTIIGPAAVLNALLMPCGCERLRRALEDMEAEAEGVCNKHSGTSLLLPDDSPYRGLKVECERCHNTGYVLRDPNSAMLAALKAALATDNDPPISF
jgi:hypothetical protein